jgi:hypothetical protein
MRHMMRIFSILVVGIAWFTTSVETASAQTIVRAVYRVSLTDPATGPVYYTDRESLRSWTSSEVCEGQKESFSGFHTSRVTSQNIVNSDGTPLEVAMASMHCVVIRE